MRLGRLCEILSHGSASSEWYFHVTAVFLRELLNCIIDALKGRRAAVGHTQRGHAVPNALGLHVVNFEIRRRIANEISDRIFR